MSRFAKRILLFLFFIPALLSGQEEMRQEHFEDYVVYGEFLGHNYFGYEKMPDNGIWSLSLGYRSWFRTEWKPSGLFLSAGYGTFSDYGRYSHRNEQIHFFPVEVNVCWGKEKHFLETGIMLIPAVRVFKDHVYAPNTAFQFGPRFAYQYCPSYSGIFFRISYTPRLQTSDSSPGGGAGLVNGPLDFPFGLSLGWKF